MSQAASRGMPSNQMAEQGTADTAASVTDRRVQPGDLNKVYRPVADELLAVESLLRDQMKTETPWVDRLLENNWIGGGKRIRPVFLLLSGAASGELTSRHIQLAAAVEMIHCATLVHDDVLDNAETRRHLPTINSTWDNRTSVLLGDFLFTHAFYVASLAGDPAVIQILARSSNKVCSGEIRQNASVGNFNLNEHEYLEMISDKTAELCSSSCRIGAMLSGADSETADRFATFGRDLGMAFQIIDDVLDLVGQQNRVGKTLGTDLLNQKPTLPIIHALRNASTDEHDQLLELLDQKTITSESVLPLLKKTGSIDFARSVAQDHADNAAKFAQELPTSPYSDALEQLANFVLSRVH